ncbi:MAG: acyl-CoA dehydrogenase family protein [Mariprofundus sp.]|nr:acyl-CoA dehydrogenase family protein [Mariprofundus sp.]
MFWIFIALLLLGILFLLTKEKLSLRSWLVGFALFDLIMLFNGVLSGTVVIVLMLMIMALYVLFCVDDVRKKWISLPLKNYIRRSLPPMSATEKDAIEAGSVWWDAELLQGNPDWRKLLDMPAPILSAEEQLFLDGPVDELCSMLDDWRINHVEHDLSPAVWSFIKSNGFFAMIIPKAYGGLAFSAYAHSRVIQKIASRSGATAVTVMVPNSLGPAELLISYGTDDQKNHYLPRLASGEEVQ